MKTVTPNTPEVVVRILKIASCLSLSGKSTLVYQIGVKDKTDIQLRIASNSSTGFFSHEWISFNAIQQLFSKAPANKPITSFLLHKIYEGQSVNTPGFLFAALKHAGLVQRSTEKPRSYERGESKGFIAEVKALIASSVSLKETDNPQKSESKTKPETALRKTPLKSSKK